MEPGLPSWLVTGEVEKDEVQEYLFHWGYRNNRGSLGVEARLEMTATLPHFVKRLPRDIRYDIVMFVQLKLVRWSK